MATQPRFCANCGTALAAGARFCPACGQAVVTLAAAPAQQPPPTVVYQAAPPQAYTPGYAQPQTAARPRPRFRLSFMTMAGLAIGVILLLLLLTRFAALQVVGKTTLATVTSVQETGDEDYQYRVEYRFVTADGTAVTGAAVREELNVGNLPVEGGEIRVRYLPFWPAINEWAK